jgi:hypothetical protein
LCLPSVPLSPECACGSVPRSGDSKRPCRSSGHQCFVMEAQVHTEGLAVNGVVMGKDFSEHLDLPTSASYSSVVRGW